MVSALALFLSRCNYGRRREFKRSSFLISKERRELKTRGGRRRHEIHFAPSPILLYTYSYMHIRLALSSSFHPSNWLRRRRGKKVCSGGERETEKRSVKTFSQRRQQHSSIGSAEQNQQRKSLGSLLRQGKGHKIRCAPFSSARV